MHTHTRTHSGLYMSTGESYLRPKIVGLCRAGANQATARCQTSSGGKCAPPVSPLAPAPSPARHHVPLSASGSLLHDDGSGISSPACHAVKNKICSVKWQIILRSPCYSTVKTSEVKKHTCMPHTHMQKLVHLQCEAREIQGWQSQSPF